MGSPQIGGPKMGDMRVARRPPRRPLAATVVLVALLVAAHAAEPGENLLVNPGFEAGRPLPDGWRDARANPDFGRLVITGAPRRGRRCLRIDSFSSHYAQSIAQDVAAPAPGKYLVAAWVRLDGGFIQLRASGSGGDGASFHRTTALRCYRGHPLVPEIVPLEHTAGVRDSDWHAVQMVVDVPAGIKSARVEVGLHFTPGRIWVDDLYFAPLTVEAPSEPASEPSSGEFSAVRGDWQREWDYPLIARIGIPGAAGRPPVGPTSRGIAGARLSVSDGRAGRLVSLGKAEVEASGNRQVRARPFTDGTGQLTEEKVSRADHTRWKVTIRNHTAEERWLEMELALPTGLGVGARFWDGAEESPVAPLWRRRDGPIFVFPLSCVYDRHTGVALGLSPYEDLSHFAFENRRRDGRAELASSARLVVEPGASRTLDFVAFSFAPRWAWREAVQVYHALFPDFARPTPGIDPRVIGSDGYVYGSMNTRQLQMEECRRFAIDWEWAYGQFQTPGDWYPDAKHWDPAKRYTGTSDLHHNEVAGTIEDYFRATRDRFRGGRHACAMMFYFAPQFCEQRFLETEYTDSWWIRSDGSHWANPKGYVKVDDNTAWAWPLNTSFGRATFEDMRLIAEDFGPAGFAFDVAHGFQPYYGPAQKGLPGRAWSGDKSFVLESIALGAIMDEVHRLRANGHRLAVCANGPYTFMLGRRSDVTMFEPSPFDWQHYVSRQWPVRLVNGGKVIFFHRAGKVVEGLVGADDLTLEDAQEAIAATTDAVLLSCLWLGGLPPAADLRGSPKMIRWSPLLHEVVRSGWQPVPAIDTDERLLVSRYGADVGSFLVLSNPTRARVSGRARVQAGYLGPGAHLLCRYDGSALRCDAGPDGTDLGWDLAPREALVCRAPLAVAGAGRIIGTVALDPQALATSDLVAEFHAERPGPASVRVGLPDGARAAKVACNERESIRFRQRGNVVRFSASLASRNRLVLSWEPRIVVLSPREEILRFPLMAEGKAACAVLTGPEASEAERVAAQRLAAYVEYYLRRQQDLAVRCWGLTGEGEGLRPAVREVSADIPEWMGPVLVGRPGALSLDWPQPRAGGGLIALTKWRGQEALLVAGDGPELTDAAMLRLLGLLDERYPFAGVLPDMPIYRRAALAGKTAND